MDPNEIDEDLEIQMAIALSLAEAQPDAAPMGFAPPAPQGQVPADPNQAQNTLAEALAAALGGMPAAGANAPGAGQHAPQAPGPAPPAPQADAVAEELARQFAMFQQALQQGGPTTGGASAAGQNPAAAMLAAALGGSLAAPGTSSAPNPGTGTTSAPSASNTTSGQTQQGGRPSSAAPAQRPGPAQPTARPATAQPRGSAPQPSQPPPTPDWAKGFQSWWSASTAAPSEFTLPTAANLGTFLDMLGKALGVKVATNFEPGSVALVLKTTSTPSGGSSVQTSDLRTVLGGWLRRPSLLASGTAQLRALHNAFDGLQPHTQTQGEVGAAVSVACSLLGEAAFQLLAADEEDLYYDKGQHTSEFIKMLKTPFRAGAGVSVPFLTSMTSSVRDKTAADAFIKIFRTVVDDAKTLKPLGASAVELEPLALALDTLTAPPAVQRCLADQLVSECLSVGAAAAQYHPLAPGARHRGAIQSPAKTLEALSLLTPLLQLSSLADPPSTMISRQVASRAAATFTQLKGFPTNEGELNTAIQVVGQTQARLQDVLHGLLKRLVTLKEGVSVPGAGREAVLAWLSMGARVNWERVLAGERGIAAQAMQELSTGSSDGWCVNVVAVCLRFARPFVEGYWDTKSGKFADLFTKHLSVDYYVQQPHRLPDLSQINSLAGERGRSVADAIQDLPVTSRPLPHSPTPPSSLGPWLNPPPQQAGGPAPPSFIADCFFQTQTWMHVGLMPALWRYYRLSEMMSQWAKHAPPDQQPVGPRGLTPQMMQIHLLSACERAALLEPRLVEDTVQFCLLQICWLHHLVRQPNAAASFSLIPDYVLSDCLSWISFVIQSGLAIHVGSKDIGALINALTDLLDAPHAVRSPVLSDKISQLLLTMLSPQLNVTRQAQHAGGGRGALAPTIQRPGEAALVASVLNSQAAQSGALPAALMRVYVRADHVVGLDVDRDSFDKFTMRACIDSILEELWRDDRGRRSLVALATGGGAPAAAATSNGSGASHHSSAFQDYVSCLFNSLIYLFKDSLDRLLDINKVETAKADEAGWAARPKQERDQQEDFLKSQQHTCRGFMRIAVQALKWLNTLASHPQTGGALCKAPLSGRVAYSILHFVEELSGQRAQQIKVTRPEQYQWDRMALLGQVCGLATRLVASQDGREFVTALAAEPDLDLGVLREARDQLEAHHAVTEATALTHLLDQLTQRVGATATAAAIVTPGTSAAPGAASDPAAALPANNSSSGELPPAKRTRLGDQTSDMDTDAATGAAGSGQTLTFPGPEPTAEELTAQYKEQLGGCQLDVFDSSASQAYHSAFHNMASESQSSYSAAMMKRVSREVRDMTSGKTPLPLSPPASIFLRYDADHMQKMRALITGPEGTPYAYGCFVFDLLFPPGYPNIPMQVHFETTGQGRARFNPNLYADGKVCLSLINTWHASHESEKWNPDVTSTFQVLVSIQAMILVEDPYYNEPAHEQAKGTDTGKSSAAMYNAQLTLNTLRWSMIDKLKNPPPGFEDVVRTHFRLLRHKVLSIAQSWAKAAADTGDEALARRTQAAVTELHQLLVAL